MIEANQLSKQYGSFTAVRDLSFSVAQGQVVGFLGPNGAGKTTTLRMLAGFLGPTSGNVRILGHDVTQEPMLARQSVGYMPEAAPLYPEMRVGEYLSFRAELKLVPRNQRKAAVSRCMEQARIADAKDTLIGHLSKGYRQRVGLADALVANPPLLILDEPTAGLDPNQIREVRELIAELGREHTILLSTHILQEVEAMCARALVMQKGQLVADGPINALLREQNTRSLHWELRGPESTILNVLEGVGARLKNSATSAAGGCVQLQTEWGKEVPDPEAALEQAIALLVQKGVGVRRVYGERAKLEEVFSALTEAAEPSKMVPGNIQIEGSAP